jgi:hypothetical protein
VIPPYEQNCTLRAELPGELAQIRLHRTVGEQVDQGGCRRPRDTNLEFCLEGKGYPIGLLLAAQGSCFIQVLTRSWRQVRGFMTGKDSSLGRSEAEQKLYHAFLCHYSQDKIGILGK